MIARLLLVLALVSGVPAPAAPCSVGRPLPSAEKLLRDAEVVARVRADGLSSQPGRNEGPQGSSTRVRFTVLDVLKGSLSASGVEFNGALVDRDDPNDHAVPFDFVRPGGRSGNCFALDYRVGAEYLLFLTEGRYPPDKGELTPYWAPLSPTNEQLMAGARDPWLVWVRKRLPPQ